MAESDLHYFHNRENLIQKRSQLGKLLGVEQLRQQQLGGIILKQLVKERRCASVDAVHLICLHLNGHAERRESTV